MSPARKVLLVVVYPTREVIIVKTSADPRFQDDGFQAGRDTVEAFRAIAASFGTPGGA